MKTIEELKASLAAILHSEGINLKLYLGTGGSEERIYRLADFDDGATELVCRNFVQSVDVFLDNDNLATLPLTQMDHRAETLFMYDLEERPAEFAKLAAISLENNLETFNFVEHGLSTVTSIAIKISSAHNTVVFFKKFYPISLVKRDQILLIVKDDTRFSILDRDILKVTGGFDVVLVDGQFYINDFGKFEKSFAFEQIAKNAMQDVTNKIMALGLVNDTKGYLAECQASRKDILRAGKSRVLEIDVGTIISFVQARQSQIGIKVADGKLLLSSKASIKQLYKLLNDDYLTSQLTHVEYETLAKNELVAVPE
ncbi:anti-phage protein KwaB [Aquitalea denitrificans]|uniref:anti-phage protein KwaB n=1 Tax=Aquitalea denitrificans TaxID=519081 RepID=UPI00135C490B|nr:anti-phage protein KwaB [Aquitalea denitrificans]